MWVIIKHVGVCGLGFDVFHLLLARAFPDSLLPQFWISSSGRELEVKPRLGWFKTRQIWLKGICHDPLFFFRVLVRWNFSQFGEPTLFAPPPRFSPRLSEGFQPAKEPKDTHVLFRSQVSLGSKRWGCAARSS